MESMCIAFLLVYVYFGGDGGSVLCGRLLGGNELADGKQRGRKEVAWRTLTPADCGRTCAFNWVEMKSHWWVSTGGST